MEDLKGSLCKGAAQVLLDHLITIKELDLPEEVVQGAKQVTFVPKDACTFLPTSLRMAESSAALWAAIGLFAGQISSHRYELPPQSVTIDVYSATLFLMSSFLFKSQGKTIADPHLVNRCLSMDLGKIRETYRGPATNIYRARDGKFYHLHGSLNTTPILHMLGLPQHRPDLEGRENYDRVRQIYRDAVAQHDSTWLDIESNEYWRSAGTICYTPEEFQETSHGKVISQEPLYTVNLVSPDLPPVPWLTVDDERRRPLAGVRVLDLSRVVAGPTISSVLALLGAEVLRISSDKLPDTVLLYDTQIGKRDTRLHLKSPEEKEKLKRLVEEADVLVDAYRPGALERLGFGRRELQEIAKRRNKGIVHVRENCYGWKGEWSHRSGWQQIADAVSGVTWVQGEFLGLKEPIIPLLPNSDYQTGLIGAMAICQALWKRHRVGGSYNVDISLTQYNLWLMKLGIHDQETCGKLRSLNPRFQARHDTELPSLLAQVKEESKKSLGVGPGKLWDPARFTTSKMRWGFPDEEASHLDWRTIVSFESSHGAKGVALGYDRGSCAPGSDEPIWLTG
ncbi:CAIB/BAIF family enzyme [Fonsecaea pedrosoi]|nr:CAIB/BAIF family enzyme [Fonsecaea pedrosoi]